MIRKLALTLGVIFSALALNAGPKCEEAKTFLSGQEAKLKEMSEKKTSGRNTRAAMNRFKKAVDDLKALSKKAGDQDEKKCERLMQVVKRKLENTDGHKKGRHKGKGHHQKGSKTANGEENQEEKK